VTTVLLIHGGLWEPMDADRFWVRPGLVGGLREHGYDVLAPDRLPRPPTWAADVDHIASGLPAEPVVVLAGSNGCSVATLLALARPGSVRALVLAWPATANDPRVDAHTGAGILAGGGDRATVDGLLAGDTLRGVSDPDLAELRMPVAVLPSAGSPFHLRPTADALLARIPDAVELPGCPESPRPDFAGHRAAFLTAVTGFIDAPPTYQRLPSTLRST
jgi:hypothetical protein